MLSRGAGRIVGVPFPPPKKSSRSAHYDRVKDLQISTGQDLQISHLHPLEDLGQVLVLLAAVVARRHVDEVDDGLGGQQLPALVFGD